MAKPQISSKRPTHRPGWPPVVRGTSKSLFSESQGSAIRGFRQGVILAIALFAAAAAVWAIFAWVAGLPAEIP